MLQRTALLAMFAATAAFTPSVWAVPINLDPNTGQGFASLQSLIDNGGVLGDKLFTFAPLDFDISPDDQQIQPDAGGVLVFGGINGNDYTLTFQGVQNNPFVEDRFNAQESFSRTFFLDFEVDILDPARSFTQVGLSNVNVITPPNTSATIEGEVVAGNVSLPVLDGSSGPFGGFLPGTQSLTVFNTIIVQTNSAAGSAALGSFTYTFTQTPAVTADGDAVPEPATVAMLGAAGAVLLAARRRR